MYSINTTTGFIPYSKNYNFDYFMDIDLDNLETLIIIRKSIHFDVYQRIVKITYKIVDDKVKQTEVEFYYDTEGNCWISDDNELKIYEEIGQEIMSDLDQEYKNLKKFYKQ